MATIKVNSSQKNVQSGDALPALDSLTVNRKATLSELVTKACKFNAFPGAQTLLPLCEVIEEMEKHLTRHSLRKIDPEETIQRQIEVVNIKEDQLGTFTTSLLDQATQVEGEPRILSIPELSKLNSAINLLDSGLIHFIDRSDSKTALKGIEAFQSTMASLVVSRLEAHPANPANFN